MTRLADLERSERKLIRQRLEGMDTQRLRNFATANAIDLRGATTRLCIVNTIMAQYKIKWGKDEQVEG